MINADAADCRSQCDRRTGVSPDPLFVTRVNVAKGQDFAMLMLGAPSGPLKNGVIENAEVCRVVMSYPTLKQVSELLSRTLKEIEIAAGRAQAAVSREAHTFGADPQDREAGSNADEQVVGGVTVTH